MIQRIRADATRRGIDPEVALAWVMVETAKRGLTLAEEEAAKAKRDYRDRSAQLDRVLARAKAAGDQPSRQRMLGIHEARERHRRATRRVTMALTYLDQWKSEVDDALMQYGPILFRAETRALGQENEAVVQARLAWIAERKKQLAAGA